MKKQPSKLFHPPHAGPHGIIEKIKDTRRGIDIQNFYNQSSK